MKRQKCITDRKKGNKNCQKNKLFSYHGYILFYIEILAVISRHQIVVISTYWEGELQHIALSVLLKLRRDGKYKRKCPKVEIRICI